jgi:hypothetical protein
LVSLAQRRDSTRMRRNRNSMRRLIGWCVAGAAAAFVAGPAVADIKVQGPAFGATAFIRTDGRVENATLRTLGYVRPEGRVEDARFRALGYVRDGRIEDGRLRTIGYYRSDGRVEDASFRVIGYIREGVIQDGQLRSVAYYDEGDCDVGVGAALAAYVFFFSSVLFEQPGWDTALEP